MLHLVEERLGLHFPREREDEFRERLHRIREALGLEGLEALFQRLEDEPADGPAWRWAVRELAIGESFFFRDRGQMTFLRDVLFSEIRERARPGETIRFWSAGCSRGEEAYTLAILAEEALPGVVVSILGTDLDPAALERAREGWYGAWSLRELTPAERRQWFRADREGYRILPRLHDRVVFREHNLLLDPMWPLSEGEGFDLILCRNVFIYFRPRRVQEALQAFRPVLKPAGALVLGHGEWGTERPPGWSMESHPHTIVFRPAEHHPARILEPLPAFTPPPAPPQPAPRVPPPRLAAEPPSLEDLIRDIRSLGDRGQWEEALALGQQALRKHPLSAPVHHLLALVLAGKGEADASMEMLEKALYLDPGYLAAHVDRARHLEELGHPVRAARAWAAALAALDDAPEDPSWAELGAKNREELRDLLETAMNHCIHRKGGSRR